MRRLGRVRVQISRIDHNLLLRRGLDGHVRTVLLLFLVIVHGAFWKA